MKNNVKIKSALINQKKLMNISFTSFRITFIILFLISIINIGCSRSPEPIEYGKDNCSYCKMSIVEKQFGTELITKKGKINKFDSIECLAAFLESGGINIGDVLSCWVTDYYHPGNFINADESFYLHSDNLRSPMGEFLSGYSNINDAKRSMNQYGGNIMKWEEVKSLVKKNWLEK
ncbi:MAG: nitrous oxide reductase accessory protein NosL [Ignavibacteriae bacterium]|nr:nitrous oxide reductase accessory protein NosL [Ignavibacteriota bacterium]